MKNFSKRKTILTRHNPLRFSIPRGTVNVSCETDFVKSLPNPDQLPSITLSNVRSGTHSPLMPKISKPPPPSPENRYRNPEKLLKLLYFIPIVVSALRHVPKPGYGLAPRSHTFSTTVDSCSVIPVSRYVVHDNRVCFSPDIVTKPLSFCMLTIISYSVLLITLS